MYYQPNTKVFLNGSFLPATEATTGLYSQTLHYGYGVFEGIRSYHTPHGTSIFKVKEHYERLIYSASKVHIHVPYTVEELTSITYKLLKENNLSDAYIRPLVYCGPNMSLTEGNEINIFICAWEWGKYLGSELLDIGVSSYQRPNPHSCHVEAKVTGHYINSILATCEARSKGYNDALLLDPNGFVAEGSGANFFYEKNGILYTPPKGNILPGITRATMFELCQELGFTLKEKLFTPEDVFNADGAFFTGTAVEVTGLNSLNNIPFVKKWEDTLGARLAKKYKELVTLTEERNVLI
ncbi:MAG: branched-chain amino acid transaminase [Bacteroidetes bacterium]|nr:branched-chain amino acid transaminase [Bacteroidota bacterium]